MESLDDLLASLQASVLALLPSRVSSRVTATQDAIPEDLTARQYLFDRMGMDPFLERAKTTIGAAKWEQAWKEGRDLPVELAFELASTGEVANDTQTHT